MNTSNLVGETARQKFALFNLGFRPFFLGAAIFSVLATGLWMGIYTLGWDIRFQAMPAMVWHAHEMIYGYSLAVIAGFLLTAIKNWTNLQTLHGYPLFLLFMLWLSARILPFVGVDDALLAAAILDNLFILLLILSTGLPIYRARQWINMALVTKLLLLLISNIVFYLGLAGILADGVYWGIYSGLYIVLAIVFTLARRVMPFFIEKGVGYPVQLTNRKWLDISSMVFFLCFWAADMVAPNQIEVAALSGVLFILHGIRMQGWHTPGIWKKPLLWILYLAYGAIILGFALKVAVYVVGVSPYLALHAFSFGGIGMITIGMMSRVILGHTGRNVFDPPPVLRWIFLTLLVGTIIRVLFPLMVPPYYALWIGVSQVLWIVSFSLFLYHYLPMLVRPRVDGQQG